MRGDRLLRKLGPFEHVLWATDLSTPRHFIVSALIEGDALTPETLTEGLRQVQRRHPALRVAIRLNEQGMPAFYEVGSAIDLRIVERRCDQCWIRQAKDELGRRFDPEIGPLVRSTLVLGKPASEIILAVHHSIGDGLSALYLVRDLLSALHGESLASLPPRPSMEALLGCPPTWSSAASRVPAKGSGAPLQPAAAVLRTRTLGETRGFLKALVEPSTRRILGLTAFLAEASEVMGIVQMAMLGGTPYTALQDAIWSHPTAAEGVASVFGALKP